MLFRSKVARDIAEGTLGSEFDRSERLEIQGKVAEAEQAAKDEVWGGYRFAVIADNQEPDGLKVIDLGAGHSSSGETLCGRIVTALKSQALLNESIGAGYIDRNWPPALKAAGAWPLRSLRQSFLNGSLTRLLDPDVVLRARIVEWVANGDFGLASGERADGGYDRVWYGEAVASDEVAFDSGVYLLHNDRAKALKNGEAAPTPPSPPGPEPEPGPIPGPEPPPAKPPVLGMNPQTFQISGTLPPEIWNRFGTKILPKLRSGVDLQVRVELSATVGGEAAGCFASEIKQILEIGRASCRERV